MRVPIRPEAVSDGVSFACGHQLLQLPACIGGVFAVEGFVDAHDEIVGRQLVFVGSEPLADNAFHIVAFVGAFGGFFADNQAESGMAETVAAESGYLDQVAAFTVSQRKNG